MFDKLRHYVSKGRDALRLLQRRVEVGATPHDVVYRQNKLRLLRYRRRAEASRARRTPLLFVPSLINRHTILDLMPGRSLVEFLVGRGYDVFMIDWGRPAPEDRYVTFDQHIDGLLHRALRKTALLSGTRGVTLIGYCMGGTLTAIYSALHPERVRNLVTFAAPVDFAEGGLLAQWTRSKRFDPDRLVDALGNVPWPLLQASFQLLVPTLVAQKALYLYDRLDDDAFVDNFLALEKWGNDNVSFPGECYRRYIKDLYQRNLLIAGGLQINGRLADLGAISSPLLNVVAKGDHIVPIAAAACLNDHVGSEDKALWELAGGHIGAIVSRTAARLFWPALDQWLSQRSGD